MQLDIEAYTKKLERAIGERQQSIAERILTGKISYEEYLRLAGEYQGLGRTASEIKDNRRRWLLEEVA